MLISKVDKIPFFLKDKTNRFPFESDFLKLIKKENKFEQEYYLVKNEKDFAFIIVYKMKLNIFTFGKANLSIKTSVIGLPCSLSEPGFVTNNPDLVFEFAKRIRGPVLILNTKTNTHYDGFANGETLPTCILKTNCKDTKEYLSSLRSSYRRRIKLAIKNCSDIEIKETKEDIYNLYLNTYNKSNYKLEKLEKGFFDNVDATTIAFIKNNKPVGFVLLKKIKNKIVFMFCGMDYNAKTTDLYYYMLFNIVDYAIKHNCDTIDFGQTSEETKMRFGAILEKRYFYARHSNNIINAIVKKKKELLEYKYDFPNHRVFKDTSISSN